MIRRHLIGVALIACLGLSACGEAGDKASSGGTPRS